MSVRPRRDDGGSTGERKSADLAPRSWMGGVCGVMKRGGGLVVVIERGGDSSDGDDGDHPIYSHDSRYPGI